MILILGRVAGSLQNLYKFLPGPNLRLTDKDMSILHFDKRDQIALQRFYLNAHF